MKRRLAIAILTLTLALCAGCEDPSTFTITEPMREAADASYDPRALASALVEIEAWHRLNGTRIPALLKPGLDDGIIDGAFQELGCVPPTELRALWRWRNGHDDEGLAQWFVWYHQLLPLEAALAQYRMLRVLPFFGWNRRWIPLFQFQDEWYFVECHESQRAASPMLLYFTETGVSHNYTSLTTYLLTAARAMAENAVVAEGPDRDMKEDAAALAAIHRILNPGLPFPYHVP